MDSAMSQFLGGIDKKRMPGTVNFNIPVLPGKPPVQILIPENITDVEWKIINATMEGYISLLQGKKES